MATKAGWLTPAQRRALEELQHEKRYAVRRHKGFAVVNGFTQALHHWISAKTMRYLVARGEVGFSREAQRWTITDAGRAALAADDTKVSEG